MRAATAATSMPFPTIRAHRRGLPEAAGLRRGAAGAAAGRRLRPSRAPASAAASGLERQQDAFVAAPDGARPARTWRAPARPASSVLAGQQPPQLGCRRPGRARPSHPRRAARAPRPPPGSAGSRGWSARSAATATRRQLRSTVTRSPHRGLSQVTDPSGVGQPAVAVARPWPRPGWRRCRAGWSSAVPSADAGSPGSRPTSRASTSAASL